MSTRVDFYFHKAGKWQEAIEQLKTIVLDCGHTTGRLVQQTENTQATRQIRFTNVQEIIDRVAILKAYVYEAIEVEKAGLAVDYKKTTEFAVPEEFQDKLDEDSTLKTAFDRLTPGRQRAYLLYFSAPKQSKTRASRIEKYRQQILDGRGLKD